MGRRWLAGGSLVAELRTVSRVNRVRSRGWLSCAVLIAVLAGSGCAGRAPAGVATAPSAGASLGDEQVLFFAEDLLIERCMRDKGLTYTAQVPASTTLSVRLSYVLDNVEVAKAAGYGTDNPARVDALRRANPNERYLNSLPRPRQASYRDALYGTNDDITVDVPGGGTMARSSTGCQADAERMLYGDLRQWLTASTVASHIAMIVSNGVRTEPKYTAAQRAWAGCMAARGQPYTTPSSARHSLAADPILDSDARPSPREVTVAVAEATCATDTGFAVVARELGARHYRAAEQQFHDVMEVRKRLMGEALRRARELTAGR